jgi:hypothetical protein
VSVATYRFEVRAAAAHLKRSGSTAFAEVGPGPSERKTGPARITEFGRASHPDLPARAHGPLPLQRGGVSPSRWPAPLPYRTEDALICSGGAPRRRSRAGRLTPDGAQINPYRA